MPDTRRQPAVVSEETAGRSPNKESVWWLPDHSYAGYGRGVSLLGVSRLGQLSETVNMIGWSKSAVTSKQLKTCCPGLSRVTVMESVLSMGVGANNAV